MMSSPGPRARVSKHSVPRGGRLFHPHLLLLEDMKIPSGFLESHSAPAVDTIHSLPGNDHGIPEGDFLECLRPFLLLGRCLGLIPLGGLWRKPSGNEIGVSFNWRSVTTYTGLPILAFLMVNVMLSCVGLFRIFAESGGGNASKLAFAARDPIFYSMGTFVYGFFLFRGNQLVSLFSRWRQVTSDLGFKDKDSKLFLHVNVATGIIFAVGMLENIFFTLTNFPIMSRTPSQETSEAGLSPLETYYWRSHSFWAHVIPYHPFLAATVLGIHMLCAYAWNYADIFIVLCSRALYFKFKILVDQTETRLLAKHRTVFDKIHDGDLSWSQVRKDHLTLCKLLEDFESFLSPLIFTSYSVNIFFICLELHQGLTPQDHHSFLDSAFSAWSFMYLVFRVMAVSLTAAKVNEYVHLILVSIQRCSTFDYCKELERLERMLASGPIGLSGLGCFVITRAFLLMVVSVIFTVEIVLLQASATPHLTQMTSTTTTEMPDPH